MNMVITPRYQDWRDREGIYPRKILDTSAHSYAEYGSQISLMDICSFSYFHSPHLFIIVLMEFYDCFEFQQVMSPSLLLGLVTFLVPQSSQVSNTIYGEWYYVYFHFGARNLESNPPVSGRENGGSFVHFLLHLYTQLGLSVSSGFPLKKIERCFSKFPYCHLC